MNNRLTAARRNLLAFGIAAIAIAISPSRVQAQSLPTAKPESVGLSSERLARSSEWLRGEGAHEKIPGAVILVVRGGRVAYVDAIGKRDPSTQAAMKTDDIFRIYSMTKPIVSVAAMMLVEEGKLVLDAPVSRYIPAFANVKVGVEK